MTSKQRGRLGSLLGPTAEEMAKKDDDRKPPPPGVASWASARIAPRRSARRLVLLLIFFAIAYVTYNLLRPTATAEFRDYVPNFPKYENPSAAHVDRVWPPSQSKPQKIGSELVGLESGASRDGKTSLSLPALPPTLKAIENTLGDMDENKNVLFASSSPRSAAALLPLACEMGRRGLNYVHYAVMSRNDQSIQELRSLHGVDETCNVIFHDARPDYASESTDMRVRVATERALYYLNSYLHPKAIIVDGSDSEDSSFLAAMRFNTDHAKQSVIELPENGAEQFGWLARLDSSSLSAWNKVDLEIVIHAPPTGSGSLIRLLRSLSQADFSPFHIPRLTVELPQHIEEPTERFLKSFSWPPRNEETLSHLQMLSLRRRLFYQNADEDASIARFLEAAWPKAPETSHILALSPNTELSERFPHYLKYALLEYMYSTSASSREWDQRIVGINLDFPSTYLNASEAFIPPKDPDVRSPAFLWQAPSSNAVLVTGEKWTELHDFVSRSLDFRSTATTPPTILTEKVVSKMYPAWLESLLQLCRLRGYVTLYPGLETAATLATAHQDLAQAPEEYRQAESPPASKKRKEVVLGESNLDTLHTLPQDGDLLPLESLPVLAWRGEETTLEALNEAARGYAADFRAAVGCESEGRELFC